MRKIKGMFHIQTNILDPKSFYNDLEDAISQLQNAGQEAEIQYQQSDSALSALVIGYVTEDKQ